MFSLSGIDHIHRWISLIYRRHQVYMARQLEPLGIGMGQQAFLYCLHSHPGMSQDDLTRETYFNKSTVARAITQLEHSGFVVRRRDPADKRVYRLRLTPKGEAAVPEIMQVSAEHVALMTTGFSPEKKQQALELMREMAQNLLRAEDCSPGTLAGDDNNDR